MTPEDEQAILQAREDLGNMRMASLPLSGKVVPNYLKTPLRKSLQDLDENVAAWHAIVPEEDLDLMIRPDGIGAGDSHRYGSNYRPDSLRQCNFCHDTGHVIAKCPLLLRRPANMPTAGTSKLSVPPDSERRKKKKKKKQYIPIVNVIRQTDVKDDPRMNEHSMIAAYPDLKDREYAISLLPPLAKASSAPTAVLSQKTSVQKSSAANSVISPSRPMPQGDVSPRSNRAERPRRAPMQLTDQPFWQPPAPIASESCNTQTCDSPTPHKSKTQKKPMAGENIKQSSKGYLQERSVEVPKHYNQIIFPAEIPKAEDEIAKNKVKQDADDDCDENEDGDDDDCVSVYTDPALNCGSSYRVSKASADTQIPEKRRQSREHTFREDSYTRSANVNRGSPHASSTTKDLPTSANSGGRNVPASSYSDIEEEADLFDDVFEMLLQKDSVEEDTSRSSSVSDADQGGAQFLFKIILDQDCSIEMYDDDTPEQMCARICKARCIQNEQIKADFLRKIDMKYKKAMQARTPAGTK